MILWGGNDQIGACICRVIRWRKLPGSNDSHQLQSSLAPPCHNGVAMDAAMSQKAIKAIRCSFYRCDNVIAARRPMRLPKNESLQKRPKQSNTAMDLQRAQASQANYVDLVLRNQLRTALSTLKRPARAEHSAYVHRGVQDAQDRAPVPKISLQGAIGRNTFRRIACLFIPPNN